MKVKRTKKLLALLLTLVMVIGMLPMTALAASSFSVTVDGIQITPTYNGEKYANEYAINEDNANITVSGSTTNGRIIVNADNVAINLNNAAMLLNCCNGSPIEIAEGKTATLVFSGENKLTAYATGPGILVNQGATLVIKEVDSSGNNSLTANGAQKTDYWDNGDMSGDTSSGFAGIGGPNSSSAMTYTGTIKIESGTVNAYGYGYGAGIGGGDYSSGGTIEISGGKVTAINGGTDPNGWGSNTHKQASGIGASQGQHSGTITISGNAEVTAYGGSACAGIGGGQNNITIEESAKVTAYGGKNAAGIGGYNQNKGESTITISDSANVTAYGGAKASGLGQGSNNGALVKLTIGPSATVLAYSDGTKAAITGMPQTGSANIINMYMQNVTLGNTAIPLTLTSDTNETKTVILEGGYKGVGTTFPAGSYEVTAPTGQAGSSYHLVSYSGNSFKVVAADNETAYSGTRLMLMLVSDNGATIQLNPPNGTTVNSGSSELLVLDEENGTIIVPPGGIVNGVVWPAGGMLSKDGTESQTPQQAKYQTVKDGEWLIGSLDAAVRNVYDGGTVQLLEDVTLEETLVITKTMTITSAEEDSVKTITGTNGHGYLLCVADADKPTLTLKNIVVDGGSENAVTATRALIAVGGKYEGQQGGSTTGQGSVEIPVTVAKYQPGKLVLENCVLQNNNNTTENGAGGAVCLISGEVTMNEGTIIQNCKADQGGAVAMANAGTKESNTFTMNGGVMQNNQAVKTAEYGYGGGAVYMAKGNFTMNGGEIKNNATVLCGGAFYMEHGSASFTMTNGTISGNSAKYGGGIYANGNSIKLSGGSITGNTASQWGGAALIAPDSDLDISGSITIKDNTSGTSAIADNLYLDGYVHEGMHFPNVTISSKLTGDLGISTWLKPNSQDVPDDSLLIASGKDYTITNEDVNKLSSDHTGYVLELTDSKTVVMKVGYTVTFHANGHGTAPTAQKVSHGGKISKPDDLTADGWTFGGWYADEALTDEWDFATDTVTADITLYAKWNVEKYDVYVAGVQVTSENKDDVLNDGGSVKYDPATKTLTLTNATIENTSGSGIEAKGNITIHGVDTEAGGTNAITGSTHAIQTIGGDIKITGTLGDITGGSEGGITATVTTAGNNPSVGGNILVDKDAVIGDITSDWYALQADAGSITINGEIGDISGQIGITSEGDSDTIINGKVGNITGVEYGIFSYGKLTINEDAQVGNISGGVFGAIAMDKISIKSVIGTVKSNNSAAILGAKGIELGEKVAIKTPKNNKIDVASNGLYTVYNTEGTKATIAKTVEFAAVYTVSFDSKGGSDVASQAIVDGQTVVKPADPTRGGYTFTGWYSDESCTTSYDFANAVTADITLYAKWDLNTTPVVPGDTVRYIVEHYKADSTAEDGYTLADTEYPAGKIGAAVTATAKTYEGFTYNAAKSTASGTLKAITGETDIVTLKLYYDVTICTLTFDTNGGGKIDSIQKEYGTTVDLTGYTPSREGYEFSGWYSGKELNEKITSVHLTDDKTVYAGWTKKAVSPESDEKNPNTGSDTTSPQTGDNSNMWLWIALLFVSGGAVTTLIVYDKKKKKASR